MYRTIIVGYDGTRASDDALTLALQLRDPGGGRLLLAGVSRLFHGFADPLTGDAYADWLRETCEQELIAAARHVPEGVPLERHVLADANAAAALDDLAERRGADLIVLGPTHRHLPGKLAGRTVAQRLLHGAPCAVAVAAPAQEQRFTGAARIVVAYDGSPEADLALDVAYDLAPSSHATVAVCTVVEPMMYVSPYVPVPLDFEAEGSRKARAAKRLLDAVDRAPSHVAVEQRLLTGPAVGSLLREADRADLVVCGSRHYGMLHRAIAGSVSGALLTDGTVPVLVTPRPSAVVPREAPEAMASALL